MSWVKMMPKEGQMAIELRMLQARIAELEAELAEANSNSDLAVEILEAENKRLKDIASKAVTQLDKESRPIWREDSTSWSNWHTKAEAVKRDLDQESTEGVTR